MTLTSVEIEAISLSLVIAIISVIICLPLGLATAWLLVRRNFPGKIILSGIVYVPLVLPPVVVGYLLLVTLGKKGIFGAWLWEHLGVAVAFTWKGAAIAACVMSFPLMVRAIKLSLENIDVGIEAAAKTLGAPNWWVFMSITLPMIIPGLITGSILTFARSLGEFGATIAFVGNIPGETQTLPLALWTLIETSNSNNEIIRLGLISVCLSLLALLIATNIEKKFLDKLKNGKIN